MGGANPDTGAELEAGSGLSATGAGAIDPDTAANSSAAVWRVTAETGSGSVICTAPRLVIATPAVMGMIGPHLPGGEPVPEAKRGADIRLMTALIRAPELDGAPRGSGRLIAPPQANSAPPHKSARSSLAARTSGDPGVGQATPKLRVNAKAMTHSTAKWPWLGARVRAAAGPGHHVVRLSYGRPGETWEPDEAMVTADLSRLFGTDLRGRVLGVLATRWDGSLPPPTPQFRQAMAGLTARVAQVPGLAITGGPIAGTGLGAIIEHARECSATL
jgi:oxygen-dependent protoporphyrinogen oxidase